MFAESLVQNKNVSIRKAILGAYLVAMSDSNQMLYMCIRCTLQPRLLSTHDLYVGRVHNENWLMPFTLLQ